VTKNQNYTKSLTTKGKLRLNRSVKDVTLINRSENWQEDHIRKLAIQNLLDLSKMISTGIKPIKITNKILAHPSNDPLKYEGLLRGIAVQIKTYNPEIEFDDDSETLNKIKEILYEGFTEKGNKTDSTT
jgi:hypothetical protein